MGRDGWSNLHTRGGVVNPSFINVPSDDLLGTLRTIGQAVAGRGGSFEEGVQGREVFVDICPPNRQSRVRVFTTITCGAGNVRACGDDAIRFVVGRVFEDDRGKVRFQPLAKSRKMLRTAPTKLSPEERVEVFLKRLTTNLRTAYGEALKHPTCPACGSIMGLRTPKAGQSWTAFYGCCAYPDCRSTSRSTLK